MLRLELHTSFGFEVTLFANSLFFCLYQVKLSEFSSDSSFSGSRTQIEHIKNGLSLLHSLGPQLGRLEGWSNSMVQGWIPLKGYS